MKIFNLSVLCISSALFASNSFAAVILTNDIAGFQNFGNTNVVSDFEEFNQSGFSAPSDPFLQGGISYSNADNLIINDNTPYTTNGTNMFVNNYWNPVEGTFYENFSLFGFDAGWSNQDDNGTTITIGTNLDTYSFNVDFEIASSANFYGFVADDNEYFTSFNITSTNDRALNAIDNVTVGAVGPTSIPEPASLAILGLGLAGIGFSRKKKTV